MKVRDRILVITDLMLGALHADATMTGDEDRAVRELLAKLLLCQPHELPAHVDERIRSFSLMDFDIEVAARDFLADPPMKKRRLLELMASLTDRDGTDLREDEYLRDLAQCLGMEPEEYADIVLSYEIESLRESFEAVRLGNEVSGTQQRPAPEDDLPRWRRKPLAKTHGADRGAISQPTVVAEPAATAAGPALPAAEPARPATGSAPAVTKPALPVAGAAPPSARPTLPAAKPASPAAKPTSPPAKPALPSAKPALVATRPATSAGAAERAAARLASPIARTERGDEATQERPKSVPPPIPAAARKKA